MRNFLFGIAAGTVLLAVLGFAVIEFGWIQPNADAKPGRIERWAAVGSLHKAIRRASNDLVSPLPASDENLIKGANLYKENCLGCHGAADGKPSVIARGLNIEPPQLSKDGVDDDPVGETYWKVRHGIRFTGMPAYGGALSEDQLWQVALFASRLGHLPAPAESIWESMPTAAGNGPQ